MKLAVEERTCTRCNYAPRIDESPDLSDVWLLDPDHDGLGGDLLTVSVLHADLAGFTTFAEERSPGDVVKMLNAYFSAVVPAILGEGGTVTSFGGDSLMAIFGAPVPYVDHSLRACRAGLDALEFASEVRAGRDWPRFRIGIATGEALVGNVGSATVRSFTAVGDTVNVAARLEQLARPEEIVLNAAAAQAAGAALETETLGALPIRGRLNAVEARRLLGLARARR